MADPSIGDGLSDCMEIVIASLNLAWDLILNKKHLNFITGMMGELGLVLEVIMFFPVLFLPF